MLDGNRRQDTSLRKTVCFLGTSNAESTRDFQRRIVDSVFPLQWEIVCEIRLYATFRNRSMIHGGKAGIGNATSTKCSDLLEVIL